MIFIFGNAVFLSSILSYNSWCNSATDDVADETKVEVVADSVPLAAGS